MNQEFTSLCARFSILSIILAVCARSAPADSRRFATAGGVLSSGALFTYFGSHYSAIGGACALVYATGMIVILWSPATEKTL